MKIKLIFDSQFCGHDETIVFVEKLGENTIENLFIQWLGFYDTNCSYEYLI